ncbi:MAG: hypothetical protein WAR76_00250, partial [Xanthobacteraceae bacterium]
VSVTPVPKTESAFGIESDRLVKIGKGDYDRALADFNDAIRLQSKNAHAFRNRFLVGLNEVQRKRLKQLVGRRRSFTNFTNARGPAMTLEDKAVPHQIREGC